MPRNTNARFGPCIFVGLNLTGSDKVREKKKNSIFLFIKVTIPDTNGISVWIAVAINIVNVIVYHH